MALLGVCFRVRITLSGQSDETADIQLNER